MTAMYGTPLYNVSIIPVQEPLPMQSKSTNFLLVLRRIPGARRSRARACRLREALKQ